MCILIVPQQNTGFILDSDMEGKNEESYKFPIAVQQMFVVIQIQALAVIGGLQIQVIEPSKEVALQLLENGRQNVKTRKLGLDMLRQLMLHHDYVVLLVQDGCYLEALRYARKNKDEIKREMFRVLGIVVRRGGVMGKSDVTSTLFPITPEFTIRGLGVVTALGAKPTPLPAL
ncbi:regulator of MON1-CCZ1 complex [Tanacetum coccineum]